MKIKLLDHKKVKKTGKTIGEKEMEKLNEKLKALKGKNNPYSVPEGYFEDFPTRIQERIVSENTEYNGLIKFFKLIKPQLALGFMIAAFGFIAFTAVNLILSNKPETGVNQDLSTLTIEVDPSEFSEQHFIDFMYEDEKKMQEKNQENTDLYIKYLVDEDIDYITLINEF